LVTLLAAAAVFTVGLPACSSGSDEGEAGSSLTPWERERRDVASDGSRSVESALRLFSIAFRTKIPGVSAPTGPHELVDATIAVREVEAKRDQLTDAQRAVVDRVLEPAADAVTAEVPPTGEPVLGPGDPAAGGSRQGGPSPIPQKLANSYLEAATIARRLVAQALGWDFPGVLTLSFGPAGGNYAWTLGSYANGTMTGCATEFNPAKNTKAVQVLNTLAHEIVHCFHDSLFPSLETADGAYQGSKWLFEGSAEWIAAKLVGPDAATSAWWYEWLILPGKSLLAREDDGIGFIAHLDESGIDPWATFRAMWLGAGQGPESAFNAAGANSNRFLDSWASSYARDPGRGREWDTTGPGIVGVHTTPGRVKVANNTKQTLRKGAYKVGLDRLDISAEIVEIQPHGHVRVSDGKQDRKLISPTFFCNRPGGCRCPDESGVDLPTLGSGALVALTGGTSGSRAVVIGRKFDDSDCKRRVDRGTNLGILVTRPPTSVGSATIRELDVFDFAACNGIHGRWTGVIRTGGFRIGQSLARVVETPVEFTIDSSGHGEIHTQLPGEVLVPTGQAPVPVDVDLMITVRGRRMDITGNFGLDLNPTNIPITRTAKGNC
jgi:hypothetical protein